MVKLHSIAYTTEGGEGSINYLCYKMEPLYAKPFAADGEGGT